MTDGPISALPVAGPIYGNEILPCVQAGETVQTSPAAMQLGGGAPAPLAILARFGDGSDGDGLISVGATILTRDWYFNNLTIDGTGSLYTAGYKVFVKGVLDLSAAPHGAIRRSPHDGGAAAGSVAGSAGIVLASQTNGGNAAASSASAAGGTGVGAQGSSAPSAVSPGMGGRGGGTTATAGGGAGVSGAGGAGRNASTPTNALPFWRVFPELLRGGSVLLGGNSAPGAGSGAGDRVNAGGGGGGSGSGGGVVYVSAHTILRGAGTAAGAIRSKGGNGGVGGTAPAAAIRTATISQSIRIVTISNAAPAVVSLIGHGIAVGTAVEFSTTDTLPAPLIAGTAYYVIAAGYGADAFQISGTLGGLAIDTTTAGAGTHSITVVGIHAFVGIAPYSIAIGAAFTFSTTGTLPGPLVVGTTYYVIAAGYGVTAFQISDTLGGPAIDTTTVGMGAHSVTTVEVNCGGGGGGNGGGGGWIYLNYMYLTGTPALNMLDAGGGNGANGGNGVGTGVGGQGGQGGYGGRITVINTLNGQYDLLDLTTVASTASVQAASGNTGGTGGLGTPTQLTL